MSITTTEEDTFNALRKTPFVDVSDLFYNWAMLTHPKPRTIEECNIFLKPHGWDYEGFYAEWEETID